MRSESNKFHDASRWRNKFKFLFDREKLLQFDQLESSQIFSRKGLISNLEPKPLKPLGKTILDTNAHFWVLFSNYVKPKLDDNIDNREKIRRQIVDNFFNSNFDESSQVLLKKHLDDMLYLPDVLSREAY